MRPEMAPSLLHLSYCRLYSRLAPSNISNPLFAFPAPTTACSASRTEGEIGGKSAEFQSYRSSPGSGKAGSRQWEGSIKKVEAKGFELARHPLQSRVESSFNISAAFNE